MIATILLAATLAAPVEVRPSTSPIRVDAQLEEPAWAAATAIPVAYEWYPSDNTAAPVSTEVLVTYDDRNLYVAFRAKDPQPGRIRARYHERDAALADDLVGFYIDPFNDDRRAYQFRINPLGVQIDAINSDVEATEDYSWDGIWDSAGMVTADGYVVEVAVPLQQLRIPSRGAQTWGFLAIREWPRDVQHRLRSVKTYANRNCLVCQFQDLHGFDTKSSGRNIEVTPTLTGTNEDAFDAGVSARWAITPGTSVQATINPDFSQVEADAAQLDVNTRFALFFPEKRPFFVEAADFFETRLPLVFTRTIADPAAGLKFTGKSGPHLYGALFARDEITNILIPGDESSDVAFLGSASTSGFARYRAELGKSATVGGLLSSRRGDDYENTVLAADGYQRVTERDNVRVQVSGSRTSYPDAIVAEFEQPHGAFDGHALRASYSHTDQNWEWSADYVELSPEFRADSGFINQVGVRQGEVFAQRRIRGGEDRWFRNIYITGGVDTTRQFDGDWNEWGADLGATYQGPRQTEISFNLAPNQEYFAGRTYHNFRHSFFVSTQVSPDVSTYLQINSGENIDFNNEQPAEFVTISPGASLNIGRRFSGAIDYVWQQFETETGARIFTVHLPQARLLYHFSRRSFVRAVLQYETVDLVTEQSRELLTQLLFSYRWNAQTVILAGYSDNY
ncbi:MAG: sugar-binding protein, partial [Thermoanaerobaculia bacterium]